jgi:hypothetical protein
MSTSVTTSGAVSVATSSTTVLAQNVARRRAVFSNDGANVIYLQYSLDDQAAAQPTAVVNQGIRLAAGEKYVEEEYRGAVSGIAVTGATVLCVVEI